MKGSKGFWKVGFFIVSLILICIVGLVAFYYGKGKLTLEEFVVQETSTSQPTLSPTQNPALEIEKIKEAVFKKTGLNEQNAEVTVSQYSPTHAKGGVKEKEAVGGAYFIAAKVGEKWVCVYDGQAHPTCQQIEPYDFPTEMVPECMGENGKVVVRK